MDALARHRVLALAGVITPTVEYRDVEELADDVEELDEAVEAEDEDLDEEDEDEDLEDDSDDEDEDLDEEEADEADEVEPARSAADRDRELRLLLPLESRMRQSDNTGSGASGSGTPQDQTKHPHVASGPKGGQFTSKGGGGSKPAPKSRPTAAAPAAPSVPQPPTTARTMRPGDSGEDVRYAQYAMSLLGFHVNQNGSYDDQTAAAVKEIQSRLGMAKPNGHLSAAQLHKLQDAVRLSPCVGQSRSFGQDLGETRDLDDVESRHRELVLLGIPVLPLPPDDDNTIDDDTRAILDVLDEWVERQVDEDWDERGDVSKELRIPGHHAGGGRWTKNPLTQAISDALDAWGKGKGPDDPFVFDGKPIDREPLRKAAVARGITLKRGASRDDIVKALLGGVKDEVVAARTERQKRKGSAKFSINGPNGKKIDVAVYTGADPNKPTLREITSANRPGRVITSQPDLAGLEKWANDNGHTDVADWAASERARAEAKNAPKAPAKAAKAAKKAAAPVATLSEDPAIREVQIENRIRAAYAAVLDRKANKGTNRWVMLSDLRQEMGSAGMSRAEVDAALTRMAISREPGSAHIIPESNQKALTQAHREGAVHFGGQDKHLISIDDPSPRKVPAKKATTKAAKAAPKAPSEPKVAAKRVPKAAKAAPTKSDSQGIAAELSSAKTVESGRQALEKARTKADLQALADHFGVEHRPADSKAVLQQAILRQAVERRLEHEGYLRQANPVSGTPSAPHPDGLDSLEGPRLKSYAAEFLDSTSGMSDDQIRAALRAQGVGSPQVEQAKRIAEAAAAPKVETPKVKGPTLAEAKLDNNILASYRSWIASGRPGRKGDALPLEDLRRNVGNVPPEEFDAAIQRLTAHGAVVTPNGIRVTNVDSIPLPAADWPKLSVSPAERMTQIQDRIERTYQELAIRRGGERGFVGLADVRDRVGPDVAPAEFDRAIIEMTMRPDVMVPPESNQKMLTPRDRAMAVSIGNQDRHLIRISEPRAGGARPKAEGRAADFEARVAAARTGIGAERLAPVRITVDASAGSDTSRWKATEATGFAGSSGGLLSAITRRVRESGPFNERLRFPEGKPLRDHEVKTREFVGPARYDAEQARKIATADRDIKVLDRAMAQSKLSEDAVVWRGGRNAARLGIPETGSAVGTEWTDAAYVGTSAQRGVAEGFIGGRGGYLARILTPQGTSAIRISGGGESELMLDRGLRYRVVADHGTTAGGVRVLDVEIVPADARTAIRSSAPGEPHHYKHGWIPIGVRPALDDANSLDDITSATQAELARITGRSDTAIRLDGLHPAVAKEYAEGLLRAQEAFPKVQLKSVTTVGPGSSGTTDRFDPNWFAGMGLGADHGHLMLGTYRTEPELRDDMAKNLAEHYSVSGDPTGTAIHEFGHLLADDPQTQRDIHQVVTEHAAAENPEPYAMRHISVNAGASLAELGAEAFADVMTNGSAADPLSHAIVDVMRTNYERLNP